MSTRAFIGYIENDSYHHIYVHFDGYYDDVGQTLNEHYSSIEKIKELVNMGDASYILPTIEESNFYARDWKEDLKIRDCEKSKISNLTKWVEYVYAWDNNEWKCITSLIT